jgi:ABC-2 type transport system ATP-binding protein
MSTSTIIEIEGLGKSFGSVRAVNNLSFRVQPGQVTGFLGPNGAGKTTTLRMLLGLVRPTEGTATFGGVAYRDLPHPLSTVGTALEASSFHPGRSARNHLRTYALAAGIGQQHVEEVLAQVGIGSFADRRVGGFSLGMRQRLGLAFALLGDPGVLVLDEPVNGLDPEGIRWIRSFLKKLAAEGRTVLVSSHLLSEVQQSVDSVVIIAKGALVYEGGLAELESGPRILVDSPDRAVLESAFLAAGASVDITPGGLAVTGMTREEAGIIALRAGAPLSLLTSEQSGIEQAFLELVGEEGAL